MASMRSAIVTVVPAARRSSTGPNTVANACWATSKTRSSLLGKYR
jgi:hypothetical protein